MCIVSFLFFFRLHCLLFTRTPGVWLVSGVDSGAIGLFFDLVYSRLRMFTSVGTYSLSKNSGVSVADPK